MPPNNFQIWKTAPLPYFSITGKSIVLQKVSVSDIQTLKTVSYHTECRWQVFSLDRDNLTQRIQMELSRKQKTLSIFFSHELPNTWLDQCLKSPVSEHRSKSNMLNAPKHCSNLKDTSFTIFINHCESNCFTKSLCYRYAKSRNFFLRHWVSMASILSW